MRRIYLLFMIACIALGSCAQKEPKAEQANTSGYNLNELVREMEREIYDTSGQNNHEFGGAVVENSKYIFYTSENAVLQINLGNGSIFRKYLFGVEWI